MAESTRLRTPFTVPMVTLVVALTASTLERAATHAAAGDVIVYETYGYYGGPADIHVVNPDGTGDTNLTPSDDDGMNLDPQLSPDGSRIVFISNRVTEANSDGNFEIFTMATDGSDVRQVTETQDPFNQASVQSSNPTWSPDGAQIAFDGYRGSYQASEIYVIDVDGSGERRITAAEDQANKWRPDWSPDGSKIVFTWGWDYYSQDVRIINPDGTGEVNLTPDTLYSAQGSASWSPDGTRIVLSADGTLAGIYPNPNREIFILEYPSLAITEVTQHPAPDEDPSWSGDGSQITFASPRDGRWALYVIDAPPPPAAAMSHSAVSPDGVLVAMTTVAAADTARKLDPTSGEEADPFWGRASIGVPPPSTSYKLTVSKTGTGGGLVASNPTGISCGSDCTQSYPAGTSVSLMAKPGVHSVFAGWLGACAGTTSTCTLTLNAAASVTATFTLKTYSLTVVKKGSGKVTSSPAGILCGTDCTERYNAKTIVTLTASPKAGYRLAGWGDACSGTTTTCSVTMKGARSVTATFAPK